MASTINASTSPAAIVQTADGTGILALQTGNTTAVTIDASQNVGIGTTSPRYKLSVGATTATSTATPDTIDLGGKFSSTAGANPKLRMYWDGTTSYGFGVSSTQLDYIVPTGASHVWYGASTERMRIDSSGNLLFNSGYGSVATAYGCRAWVNFNGSGTPAIRASGNVSSITDDTTTATALFPTFTSATSGTIAAAKVTSTKLTFVPSTGNLNAPQFAASNGIFVNNMTVATSYTIPTGYGASSVGAVTINSGVVVTVPSGSRWVVL